jgi:hypothetical protein
MWCGKKLTGTIMVYLSWLSPSHYVVFHEHFVSQRLASGGGGIQL